MGCHLWKGSLQQVPTPKQDSVRLREHVFPRPMCEQTGVCSGGAGAVEGSMHCIMSHLQGGSAGSLLRCKPKPPSPCASSIVVALRECGNLDDLKGTIIKGLAGGIL